MSSKPVLFLVGFVSVLGLSSIPQRALAAWGENWGTMLWGVGSVAVPTLPGAGLIVLALAFSASAAWTLRKRRGIVGLPVLLVLLAVPLVVAAGTVANLNTFVNGTPADADDVNANFDAVEAAVNDNNSRILSPEALLNEVFAAGYVTGPHTINTNTQLTNAEVAAAATAQGFVTGPHTTDSNTTYTAGDGLTLSGTTFSTGPQGPHVRLGNFNTAVGVDALLVTTGNGNTASGTGALFSNTTGFQNTASGFNALGDSTTGNQNTASGVSALRTNITGSNNTAIGLSALRTNTSGSNNTALGRRAGYNLTTGSNNIMIGNEGVTGEASTIRIGTTGTHTTTHLAGVVQVNGNPVINTAGEWVGALPVNAGPPGADGTDGTNGLDGSPGTNGTNGADNTAELSTLAAEFAALPAQFAALEVLVNEALVNGVLITSDNAAVCTTAGGTYDPGTDSCFVDITTDNVEAAAVAVAVAGSAACTQAGGTWDAGASTCTAAYNCFLGGFCAQSAITFPPAQHFYTNIYEGHHNQFPEHPVSGICAGNPNKEFDWDLGVALVTSSTFDPGSICSSCSRITHPLLLRPDILWQMCRT
jgi:hypothetical protein